MTNTAPQFFHGMSREGDELSLRYDRIWWVRHHDDDVYVVTFDSTEPVRVPNAFAESFMAGWRAYIGYTEEEPV
jgi:hypothetical protein